MGEWQILETLPDAVAPSQAEAVRLGDWTLQLDVASLRRNAWVLVYADGQAHEARLTLSRAESALVACLLRAGGCSVPYATLTDVVLQAWQRPPHRQERRIVNLQALVNCLRKRARQAGLRIPIVRQVSVASYAWGIG